MKSLFYTALVAVTVSFAPTAFAMSDADCKAEWTKADVNKDNVLNDMEATPYLAKLKTAGKMVPADGRITPAIFNENCKADVFATAATGPATLGTATTGATTGVTATSTSAKMASGAPLKGANSFTETQAKDRIMAAGLSNVSALKKDADGIWRGTAAKDSKTMNVAVDFKGNVVSN